WSEMRVRIRSLGAVIAGSVYCRPSVRHDVAHLAGPAGQEKTHVVRQKRHHIILILVEKSADMRRQEDVGKLPERTVGGQRLGAGHIQDGRVEAGFKHYPHEARFMGTL